MQKVKELFSSKDDTPGSNVSSNTRSGALDHNSGHGNVSNLDSTTGGAHIGSTGSTGSHLTGHSTTTGTRTGDLDSTERGGGLTSSATSRHDSHQTGHTGQTDLSSVGDNVTHDHQHLAAVTKERQHLHETEEVTRLREVDRHAHHVSSHVQPVKDVVQGETEHHHKVLPTKELREQHASTTEDQRAFERLHSGHRDEVIQGQKTRDVIDKGEIVTENVQHHLHHVVQPVIERDVHEKAIHHTQIPVHQVVHEAPIIHGVQKHEPMAIKDFLAGEGDLSSTTTHKTAGVLADSHNPLHQQHTSHTHDSYPLTSGSHHSGSHGDHNPLTSGKSTTGLDSSRNTGSNTTGSGLISGKSAGVEGRGVGSDSRTGGL